MNEPADASAPEPESTLPDSAPPPPSLPLTVALVAAGDAVQQELREAHQLAADLDAALAGKSKEALHLKFVLDRTKAHFGHLQDSVAALRQERHQLANDSMKAQGLEMMLGRVTGERDRLKAELAAREKLAAETSPAGLDLKQRDRTIAELTFANVKLRQELADWQRRAPDAPADRFMQSPTTPTLKMVAADDAWLVPKVEIVPTEFIPPRRCRG